MVKPRMETFVEPNNMESESAKLKPKRKRVHIPHSQRSAEFVAQRNERERSRVHSVNEAFMVLKKHVPLKVRDPSKRVSKAKILQAAIDHIHNLLDALENGCSKESEKDKQTTKKSLPNSRPMMKSRKQMKNCHQERKISRGTNDIARKEPKFEHIPEMKENQYHRSFNKEIITDNSQYQPQIELRNYEQYSSTNSSQYRYELPTTQYQQQEYSHSQYSAYDQSHYQIQDTQRFPVTHHDLQEYSAHPTYLESWMTGIQTPSQQNGADYYTHNIQETFARETKNSSPQIMTDLWEQDLPSPNDSGFDDDKSTSGLSDLSPMSVDVPLENASYTYTSVWNTI